MKRAAALLTVIFLAYISLSLQYEYETKTFDAKIDHFSFTTEDTFKLRYLINHTWWDPSLATSPIFFYTGNEGDIHAFANNSGLIWEFAPSFNALVVFAEHRYYGQSLPFGNASFSDPKHSGYLSSSQALADYIDLIAHLKNNYPKTNGHHTPVIAFGGSYGGMLAAWIRMKYPAVISGSLAASAPIWQFTNMTACDAFSRVTTSAYRESGTHKCVQTISDSWGAINKLGSSDDGRKWLTQNFKLCKPITDSTGVSTLKDWLSEMYVNIAMVNYPYPSTFLLPLPGHPVKHVCDLIDIQTSKEKPLLQAIFKGVNLFFNGTGKTTCMDVTSDGLINLSAAGWDYQTCTEMVMPMCDKGNTMFEKYSWDFHKLSDKCFAQYKVRPVVDYVENLYGGKDISSASNIIFSNGLLDPWSSGGVLNNVSETAIAVILPEAAHHLDLRESNPMDPPSVRKARKLYRSIFKQWVQPTW